MNRFLILFALVGYVLLGITQTIHAEEDCFYVTRSVPCIDSQHMDYLRYLDTQPPFTLAELTWKEASFPIKNGTGFVTVILKEPDLNINQNFKETVNVFVYSDSDSELHVIELLETKNDSGIFEKKFAISNSRSAPNVIFTQDGDTIVTIYVDTTMPHGYFQADANLMATALIGSTGPPLERAPASNARILDSFGNSLDSPAVGQQVQIKSDVSNGHNREQKFAYIVMIQDETDTAVSLAWIDGTLNSSSSFSPSSSWIPQKEGYYVATMFVWESIHNPTALSPPIQIDFTVISEEEHKAKQYDDGKFLEMFMFVIPQNEFGQFTKFDLRTLHYYEINQQEIQYLPRLELLVKITSDFPFEPVSNLALRISDEQIMQYVQFFEQKCIEQRPYASSDSCKDPDFAFEYQEKWYYVYPKLAPHNDAIEDRKPGMDVEYFIIHEK